MSTAKSGSFCAFGGMVEIYYKLLQPDETVDAERYSRQSNDLVDEIEGKGPFTEQERESESHFTARQRQVTRYSDHSTNHH